MAGLPDPVLRFCAHCIWGGNAQWKNFVDAGVTMVAAAARNQASRVGTPHLQGIRVGGFWGPAMRSFAGGAVLREGVLIPAVPSASAPPAWYGSRTRMRCSLRRDGRCDVRRRSTVTALPCFGAGREVTRDVGEK
jgi:hypothetical protein